MFLFGVEARGADTNYLDGARDFKELAERMSERNPDSIRRDKDGKVVYIGPGPVSDDNLSLIIREPSIRELCLIGWRVTDKGLAALQQMTNLVSLKLASRNSVQIVCRLTQLRQLDMWCNALRPADLRYLIQMTNLEELEIPAGPMMGSNALTALRKLPHLKRLVFGDREYIRDGPVKELRTENNAVRTIGDDQQADISKQLQSLTNLVFLEELELQDFEVFGDDELRRLGKLPRLKSLTLYDTPVSENWTNIVRQFPALTNAVARSFEERKEQRWVRERWGKGWTNTGERTGLARTGTDWRGWCVGELKFGLSGAGCARGRAAR